MNREGEGETRYGSVRRRRNVFGYVLMLAAIALGAYHLQGVHTTSDDVSVSLMVGTGVLLLLGGMFVEGRAVKDLLAGLLPFMRYNRGE